MENLVSASERVLPTAGGAGRGMVSAARTPGGVEMVIRRGEAVNICGD